jgi:nucleoside-diphosphate-sugar epimerase
MTRYLVTGGAGFIGSHIAERLLHQGHEVRILDNFSTSFPENLEALPKGYDLIEGDLRNRADVERAVKGVEVIFHQAALPSVPRSIEDPLTSNAVNVEGTLNLLWAAHRAKVRRLMFASSSSVYGDNPVSPKREDMPLQPLSPYAATKAMGEYYCKIFNDLYGLETVCRRYLNVFGPRQNPESQYAAVVPKFFTFLKAGKRCPIFGDGEQARDFTFVQNVVDANLIASEAKGAPGGVFNVACSLSVTVNDLYRKIARLVGSDLEPDYQPARAGEIRNSLADISAARERMDYRPAVTLDEGLRRTWDYFKK